MKTYQKIIIVLMPLLIICSFIFINITITKMATKQSVKEIYEENRKLHEDKPVIDSTCNKKEAILFDSAGIKIWGIKKTK